MGEGKRGRKVVLSQRESERLFMTKLAFDDRFGGKMEVCDLCNDPRIIEQDGNKVCASCHCVNEIQLHPKSD